MKPPSEPDAADLAPLVGANVRRVRKERGLTLDDLSSVSRVSRAMLSQIELGRSAPTVNVLVRIAAALDTPFAALAALTPHAPATVLRASRARFLESPGGAFRCRRLLPPDAGSSAEFYELRLKAHGVERSDAGAEPGASAMLVVVRGAWQVTLGGDRHLLGTGDAVHFEFKRGYVHENPGPEEALAYLVVERPRRSIQHPRSEEAPWTRERSRS